ncbi:DUF2934 domain-containing protein [Paraburkholderia fungorum]|uniref:DUF2934 domain-containing protein n=1 Tax=Paraburkholderia fungorum TaxID=134537 RepID=UPI0038B72F6D
MTFEDEPFCEALIRTVDDGEMFRPSDAFFWRLKMDVPVTEEQIQTLAFYLWEKEGSPDGRSQEYWGKARQQLGADGSLAELDSDTSPM